MSYYDELKRAMTMLAVEHRAIFIGQSVVAGGTGMTATLADVPMVQKIEPPVIEDAQMGFATGMALDGALPVCLYPRINFLLLAMGQLILHLDCLPRISDYRPRVIIRTMIAADFPLNPGPQHLGDYSYGIEAMLQTVKVVRLEERAQIVPEYAKAAEREGSTLLIEYAQLYQEE
jgi:pyruvate/2-oxoglutarate/acetoin dehydrogenase E1 component